MTTTYTSGLRLTNQPEGGNASTWGEIADNNFEFIDDAITRVQEIDMTGATSHTLTIANGADDEARSAVLEIIGTPASANSIIIPDAEKIYAVHAQHTSVAGGITVRTNSGTGVTYLTGNKGFVYCDGVSVYDLNPPVSALDPSNNLSDVENVSSARDNLGVDYATILTQITSSLTSSIFEGIYPVGSIYSNRTDSTNPGTLMSFGTWASAGVGRVLIGVGTAVDANTSSVTISAETCGGEYNHFLTSGELPEMTVEVFEEGENKPLSTGTTGGGTYQDIPQEQTPGGANDRLIVSFGSGEGHNNLQPWYSVYHWVRTA